MYFFTLEKDTKIAMEYGSELEIIRLSFVLQVEQSFCDIQIK